MKKILAILLSLLTLLSCGFLSACSAEKTQPDTPDTETVWEMVSEAYIYAFPLVLTDATKTLSTNTDGTMTGRAPINQFNHAKKLADASFRTVVTPNVDTVYSQAWLDISTEPMVYVLPETDRFCNVQLLDAWTNTAAVLDKAGAYAIALPGWEGELPDGVTRVDVPTATMWSITRTVLSGNEDLPNVYAIQEQMQLLPLSAYVQGGEYAAPQGAYKEENDFVPVNKVLSMTPAEFFNTANALMQVNPPADADKELLKKLSAINVGAEKADLGLSADVKPATDFTAKANAAIYDELDFDDKQEYEFATRGLIDAPETLELKDEDGKILWSQEAYAFLDDYEKAPDSVNPSLWENTKNNHAYGLFEVTDGIYQVRGYDMANLTVVKGDTGWIVFDTLMSVECSQAAMQLIEKNLGKFPVKAVIISHSHVDHFGGIAGVMAKEDKADETLSIEDQLASGKIPVITPVGFTEHSVKENVYAGKGMGRRSNYQYGILLTPGVTGKLAQGIGMGQSTGTVSFMTPSYEITQSGEKLTIDGVELEFQLTPGTEAPSEMNTWLPQYKALWMAENCTGTLHNLYTLRGAEVRDGAAWASYITEAISLYGKEAEVTFQSHNWPHWGNDVVNDYMVNTAAVYKYINDQTLTYINQGYTSDEISNMIELPEALNKIWYTRQYYGTVAHNAKAVYQKFMGWYDSNPVNLNPLMPSDSAKKWVEYLGDVDKVLQMAKADFDKGEYQWVAEVTNTIVFADPTNTDARLLCADALEQLGYQAESGPWRNEYLTAAQELRHGNANFTASTKSTGDMVKALSAPMLFDYMAIVMDKQALADRDFTMNVILPDVGEQHMLRVKNGVLLVYADTLSDDADVSITCPKNALFAILTNNQETVAKAVKVEGSAELLTLMMENMNQLPITGTNPFNIIEP